MKKKPILVSSAIVFAFIATLSFFAFKPVAREPVKDQKVAASQPDLQGCSSSTSTSLVQCCNWNVPNVSFYWTSSTVHFQVWACYIPSPTPPWTSFNQIGTLATAFRPTSTVVVTATEGAAGSPPPNPAIFQVTIYTSGAIYIQQTSGRSLTNTRGTSFNFAYSPSCPAC